LRAFTECQARDLEGSGVVVVCLELDGHRTPMTRRRLAGTDYERQEPPGAAVDLFFYAATGPAELLHGRTLSEARFRADRDAEARLNSALSTCPPWLPHMPRYFSEPGPPPGALHMDFLENPAGPPPKALAGLRRSRRASLSRYPDPNTGPLRRALAQRLGLPAGCLTFGTGASELVDRVLRTFARAGDAVVTTDPTWPVFERLCTALGAGVVRVPYVIDRASATARLDLEDVLKAVDSQTRLVYLVNPNNPLGATIDEDDFRRFLARLRPHVPVVIDEAYIEYSDRKGVLRANQVVLDAGRPVIGIRTFSKFFGLAGLRIGYAFADPATTQLIARLHLPFSVSAVGQDAALAALNDRAHAERTRETIQKGRRQLRAALARLGLFALSSEASFVMAEPPAEPDRVYDALVRNGIFLPEVCWNGLMQFPVGLQNENRRYLRVLAGLKRARHG
jgi:histidinol-phosphate aminotransferase